MLRIKANINNNSWQKLNCLPAKNIKSSFDRLNSSRTAEHRPIGALNKHQYYCYYCEHERTVIEWSIAVAGTLSLSAKRQRSSLKIYIYTCSTNSFNAISHFVIDHQWIWTDDLVLAARRCLRTKCDACRQIEYMPHTTTPTKKRSPTDR